MDCFTVKGFYVERTRMCNSFKKCIECPLFMRFATKEEKREFEEGGFSNFQCEDLIVEHEAEVISIVQEWSDRNKDKLNTKGCPVCGRRPDIITLHDEFGAQFRWEHFCVNDVVIKSNPIFGSRIFTIMHWNDYCSKAEEKLLEAYDKGQNAGYNRVAESFEIKKCAVCGGGPGIDKNSSGYYFYHTHKGEHRKRKGVNGSFYPTYLDAVKAWNKLQEE